jgi:small subunit ribosomal protein S20
MPHHKSCKKRLLTSIKRNERNRQNKAAMRTALKQFRAKAAAGASSEEKSQDLPALYSLLDVQVRKGVIPKQRASRLKSRLAALAAR